MSRPVDRWTVRCMAALLLGACSHPQAFAAEPADCARLGATTCSLVQSLSATVAEDSDLDLAVPLSFEISPLPKDNAASPALPDMSALQWRSGEPAAPASSYGVNLQLQRELTVGLLAQFDPASNPLLGPSALSDQPWLVGPVTSLRLGGGLSLDARAAWGSADPVAGHAADRHTVDARLTSRQEAGAWRFSPSIGYTRVQERHDSIAPDAEAPGHTTVDSGRVELRPEMAYRIDTGQSTYIEPRMMVGAFWSLGDAAITSDGTAASNAARHMAETGITFGAADGTKLQLGGALQEGERRSADVWSGKVQLNIPLQ